MAGKIRILHVLGSLDFGGVERRCLGMIQFHDRSIFEPLLAVFASRDGGMAPEFRAIPGLQIHECLYKPPRRVSFMVRFTRLCRKLKPDVVFCYAFGMHALISVSARMAGVKQVMVTVGNPSPRDAWTRRKTRLLAQLARPFCQYEIAPSHHVANDIRRAYGLPAHRVQVIHSGCQVQEIHSRAMASRETRDPGEGPTIGMVARLDKIKDQATLIRATALLLRKHPDIRLRLIGDGPERGKLEQMASQVGLDGHVEFMGSRPDVPEQLGRLDLFVFSTTPAEGFPNAVLEALAAGVPVVASDVAPCREALDSGRAGLLFPPGDAEALAETVERVLEDPALRARLTQEGHRYAASHYDIRKTTREYEVFFADRL